MLLLATMKHKKTDHGILFAPMKNICVPVDAPAASRLNSGEERDGDLTELNLNTRDFGLLFSSGWARAVNDRLGILIDDYEDERIEDREKLLDLITLSEVFAENTGEKIFRKLAELAGVAVSRKTSIHFYF